MVLHIQSYIVTSFTQKIAKIDFEFFCGLLHIEAFEVVTAVLSRGHIGVFSEYTAESLGYGNTHHLTDFVY